MKRISRQPTAEGRKNSRSRSLREQKHVREISGLHFADISLRSIFLYCSETEDERNFPCNIIWMRSVKRGFSSGKFMWDLKAHLVETEISSGRGNIYWFTDVTTNSLWSSALLRRLKNNFRNSHECLIIRESHPAQFPPFCSVNEGKLRKHKST